MTACTIFGVAGAVLPENLPSFQPSNHCDHFSFFEHDSPDLPTDPIILIVESEAGDEYIVVVFPLGENTYRAIFFKRQLPTGLAWTGTDHHLFNVFRDYYAFARDKDGKLILGKNGMPQQVKKKSKFNRAWSDIFGPLFDPDDFAVDLPDGVTHQRVQAKQNRMQRKLLGEWLVESKGVKGKELIQLRRRYRQKALTGVFEIAEEFDLDLTKLGKYRDHTAKTNSRGMRRLMRFGELAGVDMAGNDYFMKQVARVASDNADFADSKMFKRFLGMSDDLTELAGAAGKKRGLLKRFGLLLAGMGTFLGLAADAQNAHARIKKYSVTSLRETRTFYRKLDKAYRKDDATEVAEVTRDFYALSRESQLMSFYLLQAHMNKLKYVAK